MLDAVLLSAVIGVVLVVMTTESCEFSVESVKKDQQLIAKQVAFAKQQLMKTSWKLDTSVIYSLYDTDRNGNLGKKELHAILLLAHSDHAEADDVMYEPENVSSSLIVMGDENGDGKLTAKEFNRLFGIHSPTDRSRRLKRWSPLLSRLVKAR